MQIRFEIDDKEATRYIAWREDHDKVCTVMGKGSIGGRITFSFTPTSLGVAAKIKCACGVETDVTEYETGKCK